MSTDGAYFSTNDGNVVNLQSQDIRWSDNYQGIYINPFTYDSAAVFGATQSLKIFRLSIIP